MPLGQTTLMLAGVDDERPDAALLRALVSGAVSGEIRLLDLVIVRRRTISSGVLYVPQTLCWRQRGPGGVRRCVLPACVPITPAGGVNATVGRTATDQRPTRTASRRDDTSSLR